MPEVAGVTHRYVETRAGVQLHVVEAGVGDAPPLLLLHGWPQHWWCWRHLIPTLARHHRVLAPDLRGFGWSDAPPGNYSKLSLARDVLELLDAEQLAKVPVIGHDWGAYIGFLLALEHSERIERLLALDITPPWAGPPRLRHVALPLLASYQVLLATPRLGRRLLQSGPTLVRSIIRAGSARRAGWTADELDVYADVLRQPARAAASAACYRTFLTRELPAVATRGDRSDELRVPTLLAMGEFSAIRVVLDPRPSVNLRIETIPDAGHFLPEEAPEAVLDLAGPWLAQQDLHADRRT
jgi:pimeloyl-ACP methyl ester carboxylesterase